MDQDQWKLADEQIDHISQKLEELLDSAAMDDVKTLLSNLETKLGGRYGISLNCIVDLFDRDPERQCEHVLPLLNTGLSTSGTGEVYRTWGDSSPHRYVVDGEIHVVPHDRCPKCWGEWDFKWRHRSCVHCDAVLGENCKVLLDSDICPHCEKGRVSASKLSCDQCGFEVVPSCVVWG